MNKKENTTQKAEKMGNRTP